jgi:hypothetical protein
MQVTIELPDEIADEIRKSTRDVGRRMLEGFAIEGYRSGALTGWQVRHLLGLRNRPELDAFLRQTGVFREYSPEELERDFQNSRRASDLVSSRS